MNFRDAFDLERWIWDALDGPSWGFDGINVEVLREGYAVGAAWRIETQTLDPFELHVRSDGIELLYGDAEFPDGLGAGAKRLTAGLPREWLYRRFFKA